MENSDRLTELLEKRRILTANIYEEEELIEMSKKLSKEELEKIEPELLTYSLHKRSDNILELLDKLGKKLGV